MKLKIVGARLAFPVLWTPEQVNGEGEPAYSAQFLLGPNKNPKVFVGDELTGADGKPQLVYTRQIGLYDACLEVGKEKWKDKWPVLLKGMLAKDMLPVHDGDLKAQWGGFAGQFYLSTRSQAGVRPKVVDQRGQPLTAQDGAVYSGCYVIAFVDLWAQDNQWAKRINSQVRGVQKLRDGDSFGGGTAASDDEFENIAEGADAGDFGGEPAADDASDLM